VGASHLVNVGLAIIVGRIVLIERLHNRRPFVKKWEELASVADISGSLLIFLSVDSDVDCRSPVA